jgi:hypothetical protein
MTGLPVFKYTREPNTHGIQLIAPSTALSLLNETNTPDAKNLDANSVKEL